MAFYFTRKIKSLNTANWIDSNPDVMADNMEPREFTQVREIKKKKTILISMMNAHYILKLKEKYFNFYFFST